jgi:hypothetical protein
MLLFMRCRQHREVFQLTVPQRFAEDSEFTPEVLAKALTTSRAFRACHVALMLH